ncbi:MAG TPA: TIM barrel protein [Puia sp.]|nr:TIM barrel protein [Puia sp.]
MNRRNFLQNSGSVTTLMLLASLDAFASPNLPIKNMDNNFKLKLLATNWGFPGTLEEYCAKVKKEGYDGIELWWPLEKKDQDDLFDCLHRHELEVGFLCGGSDSNFQKHLDQFVQMVDAAAKESIQKPLYINCHTGRDYFSFEQGKTFLEHTIELSKSTGIKICNETHRSRLLYSAPVARHYMESLPELRVTFDVSHWCNVHESLLADQTETLDLTLQRVDHIHARIGHPEGPQVNDPRAPEWDPAVKAHFAWWDKIVEMKKQKGEVLTILTEFGPPDYMPTLPYTRQPLADQWAVNVHMMHTIRNRYQA